MKNLLKFVLVIAIITFCTTGYAQKPVKLAHINMQELVPSMPEFDSLQVKMQKITKELENELELLQVEYRRKFDEYNTNQKNWTDLVRRSREDELMQMNQKVEQFRQSAELSIQEEQEKMLQPILEKANKAIDSVAKEQGLTYVLDASPQIIRYKSADSQDILPLVKQNLGIK